MASRLEELGRQSGLYFDAAGLMNQDFPEQRWAVPGLVAEGLTLMVGSPKLGKSWLCLGLALAIADGGKALGKIDVDRGSVLYAALEDTPRRLQSRLSILLRGQPAPSNLALLTGLPRMPDALDLMEGWVEDHPDARLVIVDVLRKIRPPADNRSSAYDADYDVMGALKTFADRSGVAVIAVHHTRKTVDESDVFNEVSGSTGLTGAADAILIAKKARNTSEAVLHVTGRDITEQDHGLVWDADGCTWSLLDEPAMVTQMRGARRDVFLWLTDNPGSTPQEIADQAGINLNTVKSNVRRMLDDDQVDTDGAGRYFTRATPLATATPAPGATASVADGLHSQPALDGQEARNDGAQLQGLQRFRMREGKAS